MGSIRKSSALAAVSALALAVLASGALAQGDMRDRLKLRIPTGLAAEPGHFPRGAPGTSSGSPIAFGAQLHDAFVGVGYQSPVRYSDDADGGMTLGFGVGNATDNLGLEIMESLRAPLARRDITLNLVAGTHHKVRHDYLRQVRDLKLVNQLGKNLFIEHAYDLA